MRSQNEAKNKNQERFGVKNEEFCLSAETDAVKFVEVN